jgi:hypothetical protein
LYHGDEIVDLIRCRGKLEDRVMGIIKCGNCKIVLDEPGFSPKERPPCPSCNSKARLFEEEITENLRFYKKLGMKGRHGPSGKWFFEAVAGDDRSKKTGKMMKLQRMIDRDRDYYYERVTDPETGETIHFCEEPLSEHKGHGSAKKNESDPNEGD